MPDKDTQARGMQSNRSNEINRASAQQHGAGTGRQPSAPAAPATAPTPGGGEAQTRDEIRQRDRMNEHAPRKPHEDVERG